jgi:anthranilate phosphoribosyltransferase
VEEGIAMCKEAHAAGKGGDTLRAWIKLSNEMKALE